MSRVRPGMITPRAVASPEVPDVELAPGDKFQLVALARIERALQSIGRRLASNVRIVDEYAILGGYLPTSEAFVEVLPQFDTISEVITSVFVTGPVSTAFTLQLGDRNWSLATTANGFCVIAPLNMLLTRNDRRLLTSVTAGNWTLELMGTADERF